MWSQAMIYYIDIDNTICDSPTLDYCLATPIPERIAKINALYDEGHEIVYWTARGSGTGIFWGILTERQLKEWGCKYHQLKFGKPLFDLLVDDRAMNPGEFFDGK